jgi:cytochrome c553
MMRALKILGIVLVSLTVIVGLAIGYAVYRADQKLNRKIDANPAPVVFVNRPEALAQGKYLFDSRGCGECHGARGEGRSLIDAPNGLRVHTPNITSGGVTAGYAERDWVRAIRHGVKPNGKPIIYMPSDEFNRLTDADLGALVGYLRSLPPAAPNAGEIKLPLLMRAAYAFDLMLDAAQKIDHSVPPSRPVEVAVSVEHGGYVATTCTGCHGAGFSGGKIPGMPPNWPPAANLTPGPGSVMPGYDHADKFRAMMKSGKRPNGSAVSTVMPFGAFRHLSDTDLDAMYAFLKTLPAKTYGGR